MLNIQWGQGLCYILTQNLDCADSLEPCKGLETEELVIPAIILWYFYNIYVILFRGHGQFGYCQAGTSGVLLEDDTVLVGAPGSCVWKGNLFMNSISDNYLRRDKTRYHSPVQDSEHPPVESNSYLGKPLIDLLYIYLNICFD